MKVLSTNEVEQVSGGTFLGSALHALGFKKTGTVIHAMEEALYDNTIGTIPVSGNALKNIMTDPFNQFTKS